jgi:hypothetical protein
MRQYRRDSIFVFLKYLKHRLKQKKRHSLSLLTEEFKMRQYRRNKNKK